MNVLFARWNQRMRQKQQHEFHTIVDNACGNSHTHFSYGQLAHGVVVEKMLDELPHGDHDRVCRVDDTVAESLRIIFMQHFDRVLDNPNMHVFSSRVLPDIAEHTARQ